MCVRRPASRSRISRSVPIAPPRMPASTSRSSASAQCSSGGTDGLHGLALRGADLLDAARREIEQIVELAAVERSTLRGSHYLYYSAVAGDDDCYVHRGCRILLLFYILQLLADDAP